MKRIPAIKSQPENLIELLPEAVFVLDVDDHVLYANPAAVQLMVPKPGLPMPDRIHIPSGIGEELELQLEDSQGTSFWASVKVTPIQWQGQPARLAVLRPTSPWYLRISQMVTDLAYSASCQSDAKMVLDWITQPLETLTGFNRSEIELRGGWLGLIHPDDLPAAQQAIKDMLSGQNVSLDFRLITRQGEQRWLRQWMHPVWDESRQQVVRYFVLAQDITEQRQKEQETHQNHDFLQTLVDTLPVALMVKTAAEGRYVLMNKACGELYQIKPEVTLGRSDFETDANLRASYYRSTDRLAIETRQVVDIPEEVQESPNGGQLIIHKRKVAIFDKNDQPQYIISIVEDITQHKKDQESLQRSDAILRATNFAAERFLKPSDWQEHIQEVLERLGLAAGADRSYIFEVDRGDKVLFMDLRAGWSNEKFESIHPDADLNHLPLDLPGFSRWQKAFFQNQVVQEHTRNLTDHERNVLGRQDALSILHVPVFIMQQLWGFIGFDACTAERQWSEPEVEMLRTAGELIGTAVQRRWYEDELKASEQRLRAIIEDQTDLIDRFLPDGTLTFVNDSFCRFFGVKRGQIGGMNINAFIVPEDNQLVWKLLKSLSKQHPMVMVENRNIRHDGQVRWTQWTDRALFDDHGQVSEYQCVGRDITDRVAAQEELQTANQKLTTWVGELERRNREITLLSEMGDLLQSCLDADEAYLVVSQKVDELFPGVSGALYLVNSDKRMMESVVKWGGELHSHAGFSADECWGLRRGRLHSVTSSSSRLRCGHVSMEDGAERFAPYLCVPMSTQGEALGLLYLQTNQPLLEGEPGIRDHWESLAVAVAERLGLEISNLRFRETLRIQSIRDSLTGLFNRRYMEESLERELSRAYRHQYTVGLMTFDIDYFKSFNDQYGHAAGDLVLQEIGKCLMDSIRKEDIPCRYGGDEFVIVLPGASHEDTLKRAEALFEKVKTLRINYKNRLLETVTISVGLACYPEHGTTAEQLLRKADLALYAAKDAGRNRISEALS